MIDRLNAMLEKYDELSNKLTSEEVLNNYELLKNILTVLKDKGPLKASEIAKVLGKTKKDLNPTLYAALRKLDGLMKSDKDVWSYEEHQLVIISFDCSASWLSADIVEQKLRQYPDLINKKCRIEFDFSNKCTLS